MPAKFSPGDIPEHKVEAKPVSPAAPDVKPLTPRAIRRQESAERAATKQKMLARIIADGSAYEEVTTRVMRAVPAATKQAVDDVATVTNTARVLNSKGTAAAVIAQGDAYGEVATRVMRALPRAAAAKEQTVDYSKSVWWIWKNEPNRPWLAEEQGMPTEPFLMEHYGPGSYLMCPCDDTGRPIPGQDRQVRVGLQVRPAPDSVQQTRPPIVVVQPYPPQQPFVPQPPPIPAVPPVYEPHKPQKSSKADKGIKYGFHLALNPLRVSLWCRYD